MDATIIGLAHCGKTTLLEALAGAPISGSGTATIHVRDRRVETLAEIFKPRRPVFAEIHAKEAAWPGAGDSGRRSEIERYLGAIQGSRLFLHVVAAIQTLMMPGPPNPARYLAQLDSEMIFADLYTIDRILDRAKKAPIEANLKTLLARLKEILEDDRPLFSAQVSEGDKALVAGFNLITITPQLIVANTSESDHENFDSTVFGDRLFGRHVMAMCFTVAREVSFLPREEQDAFARELGLSGPAAERVGAEVFSQLDLISFFTIGDEECRAWPVRRGTHARAAAGEVHSDMERGFIRAEVVSFEEFMKRKNFKACREDGVQRLEGKDYVVSDGDIIHFRFNV